jgi:predicted ferric reductase
MSLLNPLYAFIVIPPLAVQAAASIALIASPPFSIAAKVIVRDFHAACWANHKTFFGYYCFIKISAISAAYHFHNIGYRKSRYIIVAYAFTYLIVGVLHKSIPINVPAHFYPPFSLLPFVLALVFSE